jgi:hypothetical protein
MKVVPGALINLSINPGEYPAIWASLTGSKNRLAAFTKKDWTQ